MSASPARRQRRRPKAAAVAAARFNRAASRVARRRRVAMADGSTSTDTGWLPSRKEIVIALILTPLAAGVGEALKVPAGRAIERLPGLAAAALGHEAPVWAYLLAGGLLWAL